MLGLLRQPEQGTISYEARLLFIRCVGKTSPNSSKNGINVRQPWRRVQGKLEESPVPLAAVLASHPGAGTIKEPDHHWHSRNKTCIHGLGFEGRGHLMIRLEHLTTVQGEGDPTRCLTCLSSLFCLETKVSELVLRPRHKCPFCSLLPW